MHIPCQRWVAEKKFLKLMNAQDYFWQKKKKSLPMSFSFPSLLAACYYYYYYFCPLWWKIATLVCRLVPLTHPEGVSRLEPNKGLGGRARIRPRLFPNSHLVTSLGKVHLVLKIVRRVRTHKKKALCFSDCCSDERIQRPAARTLENTASRVRPCLCFSLFWTPVWIKQILRITCKAKREPAKRVE